MIAIPFLLNLPNEYPRFTADRHNFDEYYQYHDYLDYPDEQFYYYDSSYYRHSKLIGYQRSVVFKVIEQLLEK